MAIRHLTGINELTVNDIDSILELALFYSQNFRQKKFPKILENKLVANLFFEDSTRTRFSFETAQKNLGAHVLNFSKDSSSVNKGEGLYDTLKTFEALQTDIAVIRHSDDNFVASMREQLNFHIINAGAGKFEHPSQSLLDLFTIKQEFGSFKDLTVMICGDINSSRVAKSNIVAMGKLGIKVILSGPETLVPQKGDLPSHCQVMPLDEALQISQIAMFLRIQHERHETFELSTSDYNLKYGMNQEREKLMPREAIIMHPGPFNRGVEITSEMVEHQRSRIFKQMENGVYTRMGILNWIQQA